MAISSGVASRSSPLVTFTSSFAAPTGYAVELQDGPQVCYQRPSVDVMFASVAQAAGAHGIGVLLTGMGTDGAKGMLTLRRSRRPHDRAGRSKLCRLWHAARGGANRRSL